MPQLNIDCEGPITRNDNAFELCAAFIVRGGDLFSRVSAYDDYLADVERRRGYKAGDTLKLVLPFLKAFGASRAEMEAYSRRTLVLLPGAREVLRRVTRILPTFIISTSYRPYLEALCAVTGFPRDHVYCTAVDIDRYEISGTERDRLVGLAAEIVAQPILAWPEGVMGAGDLGPGDRDVLSRLDAIFWEEIPAMGIGRLLKDVNPIGGEEKARAVKASLERTGLTLSEVFYVGDSITDVEALELVEDGGGTGLAFNGNRYALRAARWACLSGDTSAIGALAEVLVRQGTAEIETLLGRGEDRLAGGALIEALAGRGASAVFLAPLRLLSGDMAPSLYRLTGANRPAVIMESERVRKAVRGVAVGDLG